MPRSAYEESTMSESQFPPGWDEERIRRLVAHYEGLSGEEQLAEDEAAVGDENTEEK
jgi:hypothetical protein